LISITRTTCCGGERLAFRGTAARCQTVDFVFEKGGNSFCRFDKASVFVFSGAITMKRRGTKP
jgi:hypothetical protein